MSDSAPGCYIEAVYTAVPQTCLEPEDGNRLLAQSCGDPRTTRMLQRISKLTGIRKRYLAALEYQPEGREDAWLYRPHRIQPSGPGMSERTEAFTKSADLLIQRLLREIPPTRLARLDSLVTASCTHASSPGLERPIYAHAAVPTNVDRWNLGFMGCSAGLAGLRLVHQTAALQKRAMVLACELSSLHFQYTEHLDQMTANLLFADGAAAVLVTPEVSAARIVAARCVSLPKHADQMVWFAADNGLKLKLAQDLPDTLAAALPQAVASFLHEAQLEPADVDHWLVHPGGPQILEAVQKCLSLSADALDLSWSVFRDYGNMSSPTIFFILKNWLEQAPQGRAVAMAFGPGLMIEMLLLEAVNR